MCATAVVVVSIWHAPVLSATTTNATVIITVQLHHHDGWELWKPRCYDGSITVIIIEHDDDDE